MTNSLLNNELERIFFPLTMQHEAVIPFPPSLIESLKDCRRIVPDGVQALALALEYITEEELLMNKDNRTLSVKKILQNFFGHNKYSTCNVVVDAYWRDPLNTQFKDNMTPVKLKSLQQFLYESLSIEANDNYFPVFKTGDGNFKISELVKYMQWVNVQMYITHKIALRTQDLYGDLILHFISVGRIKSGRDIFRQIMNTIKISDQQMAEYNDATYEAFQKSKLLEKRYVGTDWIKRLQEKRSIY